MFQSVHAMSIRNSNYTSLVQKQSLLSTFCTRFFESQQLKLNLKLNLYKKFDFKTRKKYINNRRSVTKKFTKVCNSIKRKFNVKNWTNKNKKISVYCCVDLVIRIVLNRNSTINCVEERLQRSRRKSIGNCRDLKNLRYNDGSWFLRPSVGSLAEPVSVLFLPVSRTCVIGRIGRCGRRVRDVFAAVASNVAFHLIDLKARTWDTFLSTSHYAKCVKSKTTVYRQWDKDLCCLTWPAFKAL